MSAKYQRGGGYWRIGAIAGLVWFVGYSTAGGQPSPGDAYSQMIEAVCRGYAAAVTGLPPDLSFAQCMAQRDCFALAGSSVYQCNPQVTTPPTRGGA